MNSVTREEFEVVKELLMSAARYAESANRNVERQQIVQERTQLQIDQLVQTQQQLVLAQQQLFQAQQRTEERLNSFIAESQRIMTGQAEKLSQLEFIAGRLQGILSYLTRQQGDLGQGDIGPGGDN